MEKEKKNWDISFDMHLAKYSEIDPVEAAERTNIAFDSELSRFTLDVLGFKLYAEWPVFKLLPAEDNQKTCPKALYGFEMQVLVMRVLYLGAHAPSSGVFKAYRELPWGTVYDVN